MYEPLKERMNNGAKAQQPPPHAKRGSLSKPHQAVAAFPVSLSLWKLALCCACYSCLLPAKLFQKSWLLQLRTLENLPIMIGFQRECSSPQIHCPNSLYFKAVVNDSFLKVEIVAKKLEFLFWCHINLMRRPFQFLNRKRLRTRLNMKILDNEFKPMNIPA